MATCKKTKTPSNVTAAASTTKDKNEIAMNVMSILMEKNGMTLEAAAGFCGNFRAESEWEPSAIGDKGTSIGIAQWHVGRMKRLKTTYPNTYTDYRNQARFVIIELEDKSKDGYAFVWKRVKGIKNVNEATKIVMDLYEVPQVYLDREKEPAPYEAELRKRISYAIEVMNAYKKHKGIS